MVFPVTVADRVFEALAALTEDTKAPTTVTCIITSPPPSFTTSLIILPVFFGEAMDAEQFYQPLILLGPFSTCKSVPYLRINDAGDVFAVKGGFKRFLGVGLQRVSPKIWMQVVDRYEELKSKFPDASTSGYAFEWHPQGFLRAGDETALSHHDIKLWAVRMCLLLLWPFSWYSDPASHDAVSRAEKDVVALVQQDQGQDKYRSYQNWSRDGPIEHMFSGQGWQERLKTLKQEWDPNGVFTRLFLD